MNNDGAISGRNRQLSDMSAALGDQCSPAAPVADNLHRKIGSRWPEWTTIGLYATIVAFAIPYHEPWVDDGQAWQLARSLSLHDLFKTYIRYEGSPGLWHFLLWLLVRAHVTYSGLHWICGAIGVGATAIFVFCSPFPRYLKLVLPFTYFLLFQYAVVARSYVLAPLMLFLIAQWWKSRPVMVALMLGLLANLSLHTAVISGGLSIAYFLDAYFPVKERECAAGDLRVRNKLMLCATIILSLYAFALWTAWPPRDLMDSHAKLVFGESRPYFIFAAVSLVWGICEPWILSIPFWIGIALCLNARRSVFFLIPVLFFAAFSGVVFVNWWHAGLLLPLLLCILWVTWPKSRTSASRYEAIGKASLILIVGVHLAWSAYALVYDHYHAYSPDAAAAEFLRPFVKRGDTIAVTYISPTKDAYTSTGILPYFDHYIYENQTQSFWLWSDRNPTEDIFKTELASRPKIVLAEVTPSVPNHPPELNQPKVALLTRSGYRLTNVFCGSMPQRMELGFTYCHLIFQHSGAPQ